MERKECRRAIRRTHTHEVITTDDENFSRVTSAKRKFNGYDSVPYGYIKPRNK